MAITVSLRDQSAVLVATVIASSMSHITLTAIGVALPALQRGMAIDGAGTIWVVNAYALFVSSFILVGGALGDKLGLRRMFLTGLVIFTMAAVVCGLAREPATLILARAVQGIGGALLVPNSLAVLSAGVAPRVRGQAIGLWWTFTSLTIALGPVLGGWLAGAGLWRGVFLMNVPLALIVLVASTRFKCDNQPGDGKPIDWPGAALIMLGVAALTVAFTEGPGRGWSDPLVVGASIIGVVALAGFIRVQKRSDHPLVPPRLFQSRVFTAGNILTFFLYMALSVVFFFLPLNLIQAQGYPESLAGLASLPYIILMTVISAWAGGLYDRIGSRLMLTIGPLVAGLGMAVLGLPGMTGGPADYWLTFFPGIALLGIGMGVTVAPLTAAVMKSAPDSLAGAASGTNNAVASTAGVLGIAILGAFALTVFGRALAADAAALPIGETARLALMAEADQLGGATVPPGIIGDTAAAAALMLRQGFATTFRLIMFVCAILAWASALVWYSLCRGQFVPPRWVTE